MSEWGGGLAHLTLLTAMQARLHALGFDLHGRPMRILGMGALAFLDTMRARSPCYILLSVHR